MASSNILFLVWTEIQQFSWKCFLENYRRCI